MNSQDLNPGRDITIMIMQNPNIFWKTAIQPLDDLQNTKQDLDEFYMIIKHHQKLPANSQPSRHIQVLRKSLNPTKDLVSGSRAS